MFGIWWAFSCCCCWECCASRVDLKLNRWSRVTLNVWTYCFRLPSAKNPGVCYYTQFYLFLGNEPRASSILGQYSVSWISWANLMEFKKFSPILEIFWHCLWNFYFLVLCLYVRCCTVNTYVLPLSLYISRLYFEISLGTMSSSLLAFAYGLVFFSWQLACFFFWCCTYLQVLFCFKTCLRRISIFISTFVSIWSLCN